MTVGGKLVHVTPTEFDLLRLFAETRASCSPTARSCGVWGPAYQIESHYLHVYISRLRQKIEPDPTRPRYLITEPGAGYRLVRPPAADAPS